MTNIEKVKNYYSKFDEWNRLETPEGQLEFEIVINIIKQYVSPNSEILDLGGGPGRHTAALSTLGFNMYLADLSEQLIETAKEKINHFGNPNNVIQIDVCNALDLSKYKNEMFDVVLLFGPLYHLTTEKEINKCLSNVHRVLKKKGKIFAIYIPWISGLAGIMERAFYAPNHVDPEALTKTYNEGVFNNLSDKGFQEGAYIKTDKMNNLFEQSGFSKLLLRSIRGIGYRQEKNIVSLKETNYKFYKTMLKIIEDTAVESSVIETCGHAIYVGDKQ